MTDSIDSLEGTAPPHNNLAESVSVGAMLLSPAIADAVSEILRGEDFYRPAHRTIFDAIVRLSIAGQPADGATVAAELARTGDLERIGGVPYLHTLVSSVPVAANGPHYARTVAEMAVRRRIVEAGVKSMQIARAGDDIADVREQAQQAMYEATTAEHDRAPILSVGDLAGPTIAHIEAIADGRIPPGIPTGFSDLDRVLSGGFRPGQLVIPAGRTSMGKSVVTQNFLAHCASTTVRPTVLFSVEMSLDEMMQRLLSQVGRIPLHALTSGWMPPEYRDRMHAAEQEIATWPLFMVDNVRTVPAIRSYLRRFRQRMGDLAMFGVDYLQQLTWHGPRVDRHVAVGQIAKDLKIIAQDTESVCIAPCQLNRGPETRPGKNANEPRLSDLRESGDLEQTADVVILLYRPSYYDKESHRNGEADFIVAKNRNGPTDKVTVAEQLHLAKFCDMQIIEPLASD